MTYRKEVIRLHAFVMKLNVQLHSSVSKRRKLLSIYRTTGGVGLKVGLNTMGPKVCLNTVGPKVGLNTVGPKVCLNTVGPKVCLNTVE
jgi:hypothetical protein